MLRHSLPLSLLLIAVTFSATRAEEVDARAKAVIDKAVDAAGGSKNLEKYKAVSFSDKGTYYGMGEGLPYTGKFHMQYPDRVRMEIVGVFTQIVNRDKGWAVANDTVTDLTEAQVKEQVEQNYSGWVTSLSPLSKPEFKLSLIGEAKVNDRPAIAVKVSSKGHRDVDLFFDTETYLLAKAEYNTKPEELGGKETFTSVYYSNYKKVNGIQVAMKMEIKHGDKLFLVSETQEVELLEKLDDSLFAQPK